MYKLFMGLLGFALASSAAERFYAANATQQAEMKQALMNIGEIALLPIFSIALYFCLKLFFNTKLGKRLTSLR